MAEFPNIRVLLVENDEVSIFVMEKILQKHFTVTVARNGIEALHFTHKKTFDIVLLDIDLGHSMDGTEVLDEMKKDPLNDNTKVFAVTGIGLPDDGDYYEGLGFDGFFHKPVNHREIVEIIKEECYVKTL
jgi:CheY-like chemotaxis protein